MTLTLIDMPTDNKSIHQAGDVLMRAFVHLPDTWDTLAEAIEEVTEMLANERICRAALIDNRIVGWIGGLPEYDGNVWELHPLAVHPDFHRQGIGRALVTDLEACVAQRGALTITLGTDDPIGQTSLANTNLYDNLWQKIATIQNLDNHPYEFYQKMGYQITGVMPDANGIGKPDIYMSKRIQNKKDQSSD